MFDLTDRSVLITGGASGIGHALTQRLAAAGARVVIVDLNDSTQTAADLGVEFVRADVSREESVEAAFTEAHARVGPLDAVVNNAGIGDLARLDEMTPEFLRRVFAVNVEGVALGLKHGSRHLRDGGSIVNTASLAGLIGIGGYAAYSASKAAVISLTRTAAIEFGPRGIRVNAVCPGTIRTPIQPDDDPEYLLAARLSQLGRFGETDDVTGVFHFLIADESRYLTGQALVVDGGWSTGVSELAMNRLGE